MLSFPGIIDDMDLISSQETLLTLKNELAVTVELFLGSLYRVRVQLKLAQSGVLHLIFILTIAVSWFHAYFLIPISLG